MYSGVRLTALAENIPLLHTVWEYKEKTGIGAGEQYLYDQFEQASILGFNYIIDTIKVVSSATNRLYINKIDDSIWSFNDRMQKYKEYSEKFNINVVIELDFSVAVTYNNVDEYIRFILQDLINIYSWVKYWIIGINPDEKLNNTQFRCAPQFYFYILKNVYTQVKAFDASIKIGGPNIGDIVYSSLDSPQNSLDMYINNKTGWLAIAISYIQETSEYIQIESGGFLRYIDFFAIRGENTIFFNYNTFPAIIDNLRTMFFEQINANTLSIFITNQGYYAAFDANTNVYDLKAYNDIKNLLMLIKCGTLPFKTQLISYENNSEYNYGIVAQDFNLNLYSYNLYKFILYAIKNYNIVTTTANLYEDNDNIETITFQKEEQGVITNITIIWPKIYNAITIILLPASYLREYQTINMLEPEPVNVSTQINLLNTHFLIVYEKIEQLELDENDIYLNIERRLRYQHEILEQMVYELPSSFNKECTDQNFYKLLRSIAIELADASVHLTMVKEDFHIDTVRGDSIYQNFGRLIKLQKKTTWSHTKYRNLVKGIFSSLLKGPTATSIATALQLFTNFKVSIGELYKEEVQRKYGNLVAGYNPKFTFVIELEKPIDDTTYTQEELIENSTYLIQLTKPAHTIGILLIVLASNENWKTYYQTKYNTSWSFMDEVDINIDINKFINEHQFGWKTLNSFKLSPNENGIYSNKPLLNNGFISPQYTLFDTAYLHNEQSLDDYYHNQKLKEELLRHVNQNAIEEYDKYIENLAISTVLEEPKFGFIGDQYIQLNKVGISNNTFNKYRLGTAITKLKDQYYTQYDKIFNDIYKFKNTLKTLRFSTINGLNTNLSFDNNIITEWQEYLQEYAFKEKVIDANGKEIIIERKKEHASIILDNYKEQYKKIKELEQLTTELTEYVYIADDPIEAFRLNNICPQNKGINNHPLLGKRKEKIDYTEQVIEIYNLADDYLSQYFYLELKEIYDQNIYDNYIAANIDTTEYINNLHNDYLTLGLPRDLYPIREALLDILDFNPIEAVIGLDYEKNYYDNGYYQYYKNNEFINTNNLKLVIEQIALQYNLQIDTSQEDIQYWINSVKIYLCNADRNHIALRRKFIGRNIEYMTYNVQYFDKYTLSIKDKLTAFYYDYFDQYYVKKDLIPYKSVDLNEIINLKDTYIPFKFANKFAYFINNKAIITSIDIDTNEKYTNIINDNISLWNPTIYSKYNSKNINEYINYDLYNINNEKDIINHIKTYLTNLNPSLYESQYNLKETNLIFTAYNYDQYKQLQEKLKSNYYPLYNENYEVNNAIYKTNLWIQDKYINNILEYNLFNYIYNDHYNEIQEQLGTPILYNEEIFDTYSAENSFTFNKINNKLLGKKPNIFSVLLDTYDIFNNNINDYHYIYHNTILKDKFKQINEDIFNIDQYFNDQFEITDDRNLLILNKKTGKLLGKRLHTFSIDLDSYYENYDTAYDNYYDFYPIYNENEIFNIKNILLTTNRYFTDKFEIIDDNNLFIFNKQTGKFINKRFAKITFNPIYIDQYDTAYDNYYDFYPIYNETEAFNIKNKLLTVNRYFNDKFILADDNLLVFNRQTGKFISKRFALINFGPEYTDKFTNIYDNFIINPILIKTEKYNLKHSLITIDKNFNDIFELADEDNSLILNKLNGRLRGKRLSRITFNPIINENYNSIISELNYYNINVINEDLFKFNNDTISAFSTNFNDIFELADEDNSLILNKLNGRLRGKRLSRITFNPIINENYTTEIFELNKNYIYLPKNYDSYNKANEKSIDINPLTEDIFELADEDNSLILNKLNGKLRGKRLSRITFNPIGYEIYNKSKEELNSLYTSSDKEDYFIKNIYLNATRFFNETFELYDEDDLFRFNHISKNGLQGKLFQKRFSLCNFNPIINEYYNININDYTKSIFNYYINEQYKFKYAYNINNIENELEEEKYQITYSVPDFLPPIQYDFINLNNIIDNLNFSQIMYFEKYKLFLETLQNDIYIPHIENKYELSYTVPEFSPSALEETFELADENDNYFKFNNKNGHLFKKRFPLYGLSIYIIEQYKQVLEQQLLYYTYNNSEQYKEIQTNLEFSKDLEETFELLDEDKFIQFNHHNGKLLGHPFFSLYTITKYEYELYNNYEAHYLAYLQMWDNELYTALKELYESSEINMNYIDQYQYIEDTNHKIIINMNKDFIDLENIQEQVNQNINIIYDDKIDFTNYKVFNIQNQLILRDKQSLYHMQYEYDKYDKEINDSVYKKFIIQFENEKKYELQNNSVFIKNVEISENKYVIKLDFNMNQFTIYNYEQFKHIKNEYDISLQKKLKENKIRSPKGFLTIAMYANEKYYDLNTTFRSLQLNHGKLNQGKFIASNELYEVNLTKYDKYNKYKDTLSISALYLKENKMKSPKASIAEILPGIFYENYIVVDNQKNKFQFSKSRFNKNKFLRKNVSDNVTANISNNDKIRKPLMMLNNLHIDLRTLEKMNTPKEKLEPYITQFNDELYIKHLHDTIMFIANIKKYDNYKLNSSVAYMQLERKMNNKYIVLRKESFV